MGYHDHDDAENYQTKRRRIRSRARAHVEYIFQPTVETERNNQEEFRPSTIKSAIDKDSSCAAFLLPNSSESDCTAQAHAPFVSHTNDTGPNDTTVSEQDSASAIHETDADEKWHSFVEQLDAMDAGPYDHDSDETDLSKTNYDSQVPMEESSVHSSTVSDSSLAADFANWATDCQIPVSSLSGLLCVLRRHHPSLSKDTRTLLKTPCKTNMTLVDGNSQYYHFGLKESLTRTKQLVDYLSLNPDVDTIFLQINIDGLPFFHSSVKQFWPILARVCNPVETDPFVVGIYCGEKKPKSVDTFLHDFVRDA